MRTRPTILGVLGASAVAVLAGGTSAQAAKPLRLCVPLLGQICSGNVALNTLATSSHLPCTLGSGPENAVDGAASNIYTDKWCVRSGQPTLTLQLPRSLYGFTVSKLVVKHAGAAGESPTLNTRQFHMLLFQGVACTSAIGSVWQSDNTENQNVYEFGSAVANVRKVELTVDVPTQGTNLATRIYEVEVWGQPSSAEAQLGCW